MELQSITPVQQWLQMNRKSLPYVLIMPLLIVLIRVFVAYNEGAAFIFDTEFLLATAEFIFIPLFTINMVYAGGKIWERNRHLISSKILFKLLFCVTGVLAATALVEIVYNAYGIVDDDVIALGQVEIDPVTTNFISNVCIAIAIALPVFYSQERKKKLEINLAARQLEVEKLEKLQVQARLEALQAKVNPHFLYNALNTLAALVYTDPAKAEKVILGLSELFRYSLQKDDRPMVTLTEEVDIVKTYLAIEGIRFEGSLTYSIDVDDKLLQWKVPRFLLQPLVENAVKHGTSKIENGHILLIISGNHEQLTIRVEDNGQPFPLEIENGFGVGSTAEKLNLLFPNRHRLQITNTPVKAVEIQLERVA